MANTDISTLKSNIDSSIFDNTSGLVSAAEVAEILKNVCDSFLPNNMVYTDEFQSNEGLVLYDSQHISLFYDPLEMQLKMENYNGDRYAITAEIYKGTAHYKFSSINLGVGVKFISYDGLSDPYFGFSTDESIRLSLTIKSAVRTEMINCLFQLAITTIDCHIQKIR